MLCFPVFRAMTILLSLGDPAEVEGQWANAICPGHEADRSRFSRLEGSR